MVFMGVYTAGCIISSSSWLLFSVVYLSFTLVLSRVYIVFLPGVHGMFCESALPREPWKFEKAYRSLWLQKALLESC